MPNENLDWVLLTDISVSITRLYLLMQGERLRVEVGKKIQKRAPRKHFTLRFGLAEICNGRWYVSLNMIEHYQMKKQQLTISTQGLDELIKTVVSDAVSHKRRCDAINKLLEAINKQKQGFSYTRLTDVVPLPVWLKKCVFLRISAIYSLLVLHFVEEEHSWFIIRCR